MAGIPKERKALFIRTVFDLLMENPEGTDSRYVLAEVEKRVTPTPFENEIVRSGSSIRRFENDIRFLTINVVKAGWMIKNRGEWSLTEAGRKAYGTYPDQLELFSEVNKRFRAWQKSRRNEASSPDDDESDSLSSGVDLETAEEAAWREISSYLHQMPAPDLEKLVAGLLRGMGYHVTWAASGGPDGGLDVIAYSDPLGVEGRCIKVQVKRRVDRIGAPELRSFLPLLYEADVGVYVALGGFTKESEKEARQQESRQLMLLDAKKLFDLWVEHYDRIPEKDRRLLPLRPIYYLAPEE